MTLDLPEVFELTDFKLRYGPRIESMTINGQPLFPEKIHTEFPLRRPSWNRIPAAAKYSFANNQPDVLKPLLRPGENVIEIAVAADKAWEERPFSLYVRFRIPLSIGTR